MHPQAFEYVASALLARADPRPKKVVEFGSFDVNGSVRPLLTDAEYLGIDAREGKGVDLVIDAATWEGKGYDLVVSTETLEHAPDPEAVIASARRALVMDGLFIATMAAPERAPHNVDGAKRLGPDEHYANISEDQLREWLGRGWEILDLQHWPERGDLYVTARKVRKTAKSQTVIGEIEGEEGEIESEPSEEADQV